MTTAASASGFRLLPWDSSLFGFPVAQIAADAVAGGGLPEVMAALRSSGVRLAYAAVPADDSRAIAALEATGGQGVDRKVRYRKTRLSAGPAPAGIESVFGHPCTAELEHLALASGVCSRFRTDPLIAPDVFRALYVAWIRRSMAGEIAREVFVIRDGVACAGMITLTTLEPGPTGVIGLIAVADGHRGKGYGRRLMLAAEAWCAAHGMPAIEVATQQRNAAACGLYAACGYEVVRNEAVFHIWLSP